jgi:glutaredoxin 2
LGDLDALLADTKRYIGELIPDLEQIDRMLESPRAVNGALSLDDVRVLPVLRSLAVVKELRFPQRLRSYFESMMALIGARPLPAV